MINWKKPPCNPKTELACMSCRRYYVFRHDRYHPEYSTIEFEIHFQKCKFCQDWVYAYNSNPDSVHNLFRPIDLWNRNSEPNEEMSELDKMMREALEDEGF